MEQTNPLRHILAIIVALLPLGYLATQWGGMPAVVPTHFGVDGLPDAYGSKTYSLIMIVGMAIVSLLTYLLIINAHKLDKKRTKGKKLVNADTIGIASVSFITIINLVIIVNTVYPKAVLLDKVLIPVIGVFFAFLGNMMYNVKPNLFIGVRVPWTLNDEDNWRYTHRLASKLFFVAGVLITLVALGYETKVAVLFMTITVLLISTVTIVYSYLFYRKNKKQNISE